MGKIVAIFNQKGGTGKTTTTQSLAYELHERGKKVLLIDADLQENLSLSVGVRPDDETPDANIYTLLCDTIDNKKYNPDLSDYITKNRYGVDIITSNENMSTIDAKIFPLTKFKTPLDSFLEKYAKDFSLQMTVEEDDELKESLDEFVELNEKYQNSKNEIIRKLCDADLMVEQDGLLLLKKILTQVKDDYDFILIDCPPSLSTITENVLNAADCIIVPTALEPFPASGISLLIKTVNRIRKTTNPVLRFSGSLYVMVDQRLKISQQMMDVTEYYKKHLHMYQVLIPRSTDVNTAFAKQLPLIKYKRKSKVREKYSEFCDKFLEREG